MSNILQLILFSIFSLALFSCSANLGFKPETTISGFDQSKTVYIRPHGNLVNNAWSLSEQGSSLGAEWSESNGNRALLHLKIAGSEYFGITKLHLNIDGVKSSLKANGVTDFEINSLSLKTSSQSFATDLKTIENLAYAKNAWLRIFTTDGYLENAVVKDGVGGKSYYALQRFMDEVKK